MKLFKIILSVLMVALLAFSWVNVFKKIIQNDMDYKNTVELAEKSYENGLYDQAVEYYKKSLNYFDDKSVYYRIKEIYDSHYGEEPTEEVRSKYIKDMEEAANKFPKESDFWVYVANLYVESGNYKNAYKCLKKGKNYGARSDELLALLDSLKYMTKVEERIYYDFSTALNGYISLYNGNSWSIISEKNSSNNKKNTYTFIGPINDDGIGVYVTDKETQIIDMKNVVRARYKIQVNDAGCFDSESKLTPVKINEKWQYINISGGVDNNKYDFAGSFCKNRAAVCEGGKWYIIDKDFNKVTDKAFDDIKLDLYSNCVQGELIIAKENGKYHLYDLDFKVKGDFECDEIDICIKKNPIAFKKGEKWGFVNPDGSIAIEPTYADAKSFSEKFAAVANDSGKWGYINSDNKLVVEYEYSDAFYFDKNQRSMISITKDSYQILTFLL